MNDREAAEKAKGEERDKEARDKTGGRKGVNGGCK